MHCNDLYSRKILSVWIQFQTLGQKNSIRKARINLRSV